MVRTALTPANIDPPGADGTPRRRTLVWHRSSK